MADTELAFAVDVGQIIFMIDDVRRRIVPVCVTELIVRRTMGAVRYTIMGRTRSDMIVEIDGSSLNRSTFSSTEDVRKHLRESFETALDYMVTSAADEASILDVTKFPPARSSQGVDDVL